MARIVVVKCPNCGANVKLDPHRDAVTCAFCGTSSILQREGAPTPAHSPNTRVIVVPRPAPGGAIAVVLVTTFMVLALAVAGVVFLKSQPAAPPGRADAPRPTAQGAAPMKATPGERLSILGQRVPMLTDANGDGAPDIILSFSAYDGKATHYVYGAFDGQRGGSLWRTEDLGSVIHQTAASIDKGRLFIADEKGQLFAYTIRDGRKQWQTALGDKLTRYCQASEADSIRVVTAENRMLVIDVKTGGQRPAGDKAPCAPAMSDKRPNFSPEPTGYPDATGPIGVEAWVCGGVRVMGDRNFTLADQCGPRMKTRLDAIPGIGLGSIVREGDGWVLLGAKEPGTRVPMVGFFTKGRVAWTTVVPEGNPLEARTGRPSRIVIAQGMVVVPYAMNASGAGRVAAFALDSGRRVWDIALPAGVDGAEELVATKDAVLVTDRTHLTALALKDGSVRFVLGEIRSP
jgi:hypothetical protein